MNCRYKLSSVASGKVTGSHAQPTNTSFTLLKQTSNAIKIICVTASQLSMTINAEPLNCYMLEVKLKPKPKNLKELKMVTRTI